VCCAVKKCFWNLMTIIFRYIDSFKDINNHIQYYIQYLFIYFIYYHIIVSYYNHIYILEPIINQQKLNNNWKKKGLDVIYVWIKNIYVSIYKNIPRLQFTYVYCIKIYPGRNLHMYKIYPGWNLHKKFEMGYNLQRSIKIIPNFQSW